MVDIYAAIAVGIALIIGIVPPLIMYLKSEDKDSFWVTYTIHKELMTQTEKDDYEKLGEKAFMEKIDREMKEKRENDKWRKKRDCKFNC